MNVNRILRRIWVFQLIYSPTVFLLLVELVIYSLCHGENLVIYLLRMKFKKSWKKTDKKHDKTSKTWAAGKYFIHLSPPQALRVPFRHTCSATPDSWLTPRGHVSLNICRGHRYLHANMLYRIAFTLWEISYILCNVSSHWLRLFITWQNIQASVIFRITIDGHEVA